jgi:hypothetical protein
MICGDSLHVAAIPERMKSQGHTSEKLVSAEADVAAGWSRKPAFPGDRSRTTSAEPNDHNEREDERGLL